MSDDLVKRLRNGPTTDSCDAFDLVQAAADEIEQLRAALKLAQSLDDPLLLEIERLRERIAALEGALAHIYGLYPISVTQPSQTIDDIREFAHAALEEKK